MTSDEFKKEYLENAFFWISNECEFKTLQRVGVYFGLTNPIGTRTLIDYQADMIHQHNLFFFPSTENRLGYFQKVDIFIPNASYGLPKSFDQCMQDFKEMSPREEQLSPESLGRTIERLQFIVNHSTTPINKYTDDIAELQDALRFNFRVQLYFRGYWKDIVSMDHMTSEGKILVCDGKPKYKIVFR